MSGLVAMNLEKLTHRQDASPVESITSSSASWDLSSEQSSKESPRAVAISHTFDVEQQREMIKREQQAATLIVINEKYQNMMWNQEDAARVAVMLIAEARRVDLSTHSETVSISNKKQKWRDITLAVETCGRNVLTNYHVFRPDIPAEAAIIHINETQCRRMRTLDKIRESGNLFALSHNDDCQPIKDAQSR